MSGQVYSLLPLCWHFVNCSQKPNVFMKVVFVIEKVGLVYCQVAHTLIYRGPVIDSNMGNQNMREVSQSKSLAWSLAPLRVKNVP